MRMKRRGKITEGTIALRVLPALPDGGNAALPDEGNGGLGICFISTMGFPSIYRFRLQGQLTEDSERSILWVELDVREAKTIYDYIATHFVQTVRLS